MVVLRESSRARPSPSKSTARWPPASPLEALLSSPNGRKKWADIEGGRRERSASPSSRKIRMDSESMDDSAIQDEESLRLELQILETKKRLRDLERKRGQEQIGVSTTSPAKRRRIETTTQDVLVQLSPTKTTITVAPPASPVRARLGIDNKRADSVSFKRPVGTKASHIPPAAEPRPVSSFNKRLAGIRATIQDKQEKSDRLDSIRSKSFADISARTHASSQSSAPHRPSLQPAPSITGGAYDSAPKRRKTTSKDEDFYDAFSEIHLSSRQLSHTDVARSLAGCEIYTLPRLLKEVKGPSYEPPDCDKDYVVFGILAEKTSPFQQQENAKVLDRHKDQDGTRIAKNKFMVMRLCDLQWQVDCYLFGTGFEQYWKLTEGTLIAILNPAIMPPRTNQHNGRFSLKVASSEDTILEIGKARDLGYCTAVKKDGKECSSWVNKAKSAYCEFHVNLAVNKSRKGRMEVNTMTRGQEPQVYRAKSNQNIHRHWESGEVWSAGHSLKRVGAAKLLDDDDTDALHNLTRDEISRKRIAASQRERDLAKKLGEISGGVAGGYFRAKYGTEGTGSSSTPSEPMFAKPSAAELGLLSRKADEQRLSPAKDRRRHFGIGAISSAGTEALGWGGARKYGLLEPRQSRLGSPERGQTRLEAPRARSALRSPDRDRSISPTKQARFKLAKGIRQPGRESGGNDLTTKHDDDDDDLDIV